MMDQIKLILIEWNSWNGLIFNILYINETSLFGINFSWKSEFLYLDLFWIVIYKYDKTGL